MNVLFLCMDMHKGFHGSFLHVLEYGDYFLQQGAKVFIGAVFISDENRKIAEEAGFKVYPLLQLPLDQTYDLVYAFHLLLFPALVISGLRYGKAVSVSLSASLPIEWVPPAQFWPCFDLFTALSEEIVTHLEQRFAVPPSLFTITPNHIPLSFLQAAEKKQSWRPRPEKVCVVSNHFVPELDELRALAPFTLDFYGDAWGTNTRITPELLLRYDAVITIGKTVQFCLGLGIPVFEYDRFGGCGYLTPDTLAEEEKTNFSGRGSARKRSARDLLHDIESGYQGACTHASLLRHLALRRYAIDVLIGKQIDRLTSTPVAPRPPLGRDALLFANAALAAVQYIATALAEGKK